MRREASDPVRAPFLDRVHVGRGDDLDRFLPARTDQATLAAGLLVGRGALRVLHDVRPRLDRVAPVLRLGLTEHLPKRTADDGVADPGRSEERRDGKEGLRTCRSGGSPDHYKK